MVGDARPGVVVAHPSAELYGSDRQLLESLRALDPGAWRVLLVLPVDGPMVPQVRRLGHEVLVLDFPVLRKASLSPVGLGRLALGVLRAAPRLVLLLRRHRAGVAYVNTLTAPVWLLAAALARVPALCHVHEAEPDLPRPVAWGLYLPLLLTRTVLVNSREAERVAVAAVGRLSRRTALLYNGVDRPGVPVVAPGGTPARLVLVGRLSERKGTDVAVAAVARLAASGRSVHLELVGDVFPGYEPFAQGLREQVAAAGLTGAVTFAGFRDEVWSRYDAADVVLVPSRQEPFGNVAVEAMLSGRPLVASRVQGLAEIVRDGETGLLVEPDDPEALAHAVARLLDDEDLAAGLAAAGREDALERFSGDAYRQRVTELVSGLVGVREPVS